MIPRYAHPNMTEIWTDESKFQAWLQVELAVLKARDELRQIPSGVYERVCDAVGDFNRLSTPIAEAISRRDKVIRHDLNAFVEIVRAMIVLGKEGPGAFEANALNLYGDQFHSAIDRAIKTNDSDASWFHDGLTSYDTEEPATALLLRKACNAIDDDASRVCDALRELALKNQDIAMIGRTHGQHAQPITFGAKVLNWYEMMTRFRKRLHSSHNEAVCMKLSGAVGMYGTLGPEIEERVAEILRLSVSPVSTQIVPLDRRAQLVNTLAEGACVVEKIARDLWIMAQSEVGEITEGFGKKQKGSSAMPHKKNPITLEQLFGLPRLIRAYASAMMENVATASERDISQSSVERIAIPDAFGLLDHMLIKLADVLGTMYVNRERMLKNLTEGTLGRYASQKAEQLLKRKGMSAEDAYRAVQQACTGKRHLKEELLNDKDVAKFVTEDDLKAVFSLYTWTIHEKELYARVLEHKRI
ncbi:TPA: adenylosuccinate lyase [Candidatus Uhrbacteria bacterium]|nr:adenylosuccinate lyase [Candidatus Uhrbacteria bacterium]